MAKSVQALTCLNDHGDRDMHVVDICERLPVFGRRF